MITFLKLLFSAILIAIISATVWASQHYSVWQAFSDLWRDPWGRATLFDAYFAFLTFYVWVFYKERCWAYRLLWFVLVMGFGNIGMSLYMLIQLFRLRPGEGVEELLLKRKPA
ncbi:DUF1475 domain-containing protein [bacterium]|nr:MAG: DUF1475 domain-containing protein [bacterium]